MGVKINPFLRIATLEYELAQAVSEKAAAEQAAHYIMKVSACQWQSLGQHAENSKDPNVEGEIRSLTAEVADLRKRLLEITVILEDTLRGRETTDLEQKLPVRPSCAQNRSGTSGVFAEPATMLVDLLGLDENETSEHCDLTESEDDLDELARFTQVPPKIDFGSGEKEAAQLAAGVDLYKGLPQIDPPLIRHFEPNTTQPSSLSNDINQSFLAKQGCFTNKSTGMLSSQSPSPEIQASKACRFMDRVLAGPVYPTKPVERPHRQQPCNTDPRVNPWRQFWMESSEAYGEAGKATVDKVPGNFVTEDIKASHSRISLELGDTHRLSGVADVNNPRFSNNCALEEVFDTASELHNATGSHRQHAGRDDRRFPEFFRYGVRFQPSPTMSNRFQTLSFLNLPPSVTMQELMARVRGGVVVSCQLLDTTSITGSLSARVRFLQESAALAYVDFATATPLILQVQKVQVSLVRTPTFPLSSPTLEKIFQGGRTRCLEISNLPEDMTAKRLLWDLKISSMQTTGIEHMHMRKDRILDLRFSSIWYAERAYAKLLSFRVYHCCNVVWAKDPCALPLNATNEAADADRLGIVLSEDECDGEKKCDAAKKCDVTLVIHSVNKENMNKENKDNKVQDVSQHHNSPIKRSASLSGTAEPTPPPDFLFQPTTSQPSSSFEQSLISNPSTEDSSFTRPTETRASSNDKSINSLHKMESNNQLSDSKWASIDATTKKSSVMPPQHKKESVVSSHNQLPDSKLANIHTPTKKSPAKSRRHKKKPLVSNNNQLPDSKLANTNTPTKKSSIMSPQLKQEAAPLETGASIAVGRAMFDYFTETVAEDLKPLSQSIWAPVETVVPVNIGKAILDHFADNAAEVLKPLSESIWAPVETVPPINVGKAILDHFTVNAAENLKPLSQSIWAPVETVASIDVGKAILNHFIAKDLKPLSESIWAPVKIQAKKPAATRPSSELPEPSKNAVNPSSNAVGQVPEFSSGVNEISVENFHASPTENSDSTDSAPSTKGPVAVAAAPNADSTVNHLSSGNEDKKEDDEGYDSEVEVWYDCVERYEDETYGEVASDEEQKLANAGGCGFFFLF